MANGHVSMLEENVINYKHKPLRGIQIIENEKNMNKKYIDVKYLLTHVINRKLIQLFFVIFTEIL